MRICVALLLMAFSVGACASLDEYPLKRVQIDLSDTAALQRGAKYYANYCSGCHSLKYLRYNRMAQDLDMLDHEGTILEDLVKDNLMFTTKILGDPLLIAMTPEQGEAWFGLAVPDLSLVSRSRGVDWLYSYLHGFYRDPRAQWGVNNLYYPGVAMPHVLESLQGLAEPVWVGRGDDAWISGLTQPKGPLSASEYDRLVVDLVSFLAYAGEPVLLHRKKIGVWVLIFMGLFFVFAYLLKREYWKDIK